MCRFKSGVITQENVYHLLDDDSHEAIIKEYKLKDDPRLICRVELLPKDGRIDNLNPDNWYLHVDQDLKPEWFNEEKATEEMKRIFREHVAQRFVLPDQKVDAIKEGRWYVLGGTISEVRGGTISEVWGGTINSVRGGTISEVLGGTIRSVRGGAIKKQEGGTIITNDKIYVVDKKIKLIKTGWENKES